MADNFSNKVLNNIDWDGTAGLALTNAVTGSITITGAPGANGITLPPTAATTSDPTSVRYNYSLIINDPNGFLSTTTGVQLTAGTGTALINGAAGDPIIFSATGGGVAGIIEIRCLGNGNFTAADPNVAFTNGTPIADGEILVGNGDGVGTSVGMSGDITIDNTGATTIATNIPITAFRPLASITTTGKTLTTGDEGKFFVVEEATNQAVVITLSAAYSVVGNVGTEGDFILASTGSLTFQCAGGVAINGTTAGSVVVTDQWGGITIKLIAANTWIAIGKI
tara:strand:+ start:1224 stop:2066 length:843 start_codon:yes stop_codon:yes gene_type:complete